MRPIALSLMLVAVVLGCIWIFQVQTGQRIDDLVELVSDNPRVASETPVSSEAEATSLVRDRLAMRLRVPAIEAAELVSVSFVALKVGIQIPSLAYENATGGSQRVFGIDYAFLDRFEGIVGLENSLRKELERGNSFSVVTPDGRHEVVVWRSGASILLAPTDDSRALIERVEG